MAAKELLANSKDCVEIIPGTQQIIVGGGPASAVGTETIYNFTQKSFTFDYLFDENSSQEDLYNLSVAPLVDRFMEGFNATILAYGQTGSGKTYSMGIGLDGITASVDLNSKGIVPRAITTIFTRMAAHKQENESYDASVTVSFMELYNEELVDLLNPRPKSASASVNTGPTIREDGMGKIVWVNLSEEKVNSTSELLRTTGSTDMNASSSRSHAIFTVTLRQTMEGGDGEKTNLISKFHFVDLAGSERLKRTNAEGDRKKEGISINQGLLALGNVISALGDEARKAGHVPYRDSKLTRMLQDSLGGNSQTLMLACVSPSDLNYGETVNTLHYANRARNIKNRVAINQDWGNSAGGEAQREIKTLRSTISQLRTELAMIRAGGMEILDAEAESMAPIGNLVGQTKLHYHQRRERDQLAEIERLKADNTNQSFQLDRFHFLAIRLSKQVKQLMMQNAALTQERDIAVAEKCKILNPSAGFVSSASGQADEGTRAEKKQRRSREASPDDMGGTPKRGRTPVDDKVHPIIRNYVQTIALLRLQLADCEDKLAWQYEAMSKLGQKGSKANLAWSIQSLKDLNIATSPTARRVDDCKASELRTEATGERKLLEAIRENIELHEATSRSGYALPGDEPRGLLREVSPQDIKSSSLQNETVFDDDSDEDYEDAPAAIEDAPNPDIYMLINKLQNDIVQHEALAESIQKREAEYNRMQKAYESKLSVLQNQMAQFQQERDLALKKMANSSKQQRTVVANKFEEAKRRLDSEISDTRRKMGENSRLQSNSKSRAEKLTSELQATISALKAEKTRMLQELRIQTQKHRDSNNANMREISKLRRKEKNASDIAKRLERSNQLQRLMLKKRNQEVLQTQAKLKQIMQSLKRASTPNKVIKSHNSGFTSPVPRTKSAKGRAMALSGPAMNEILASVNSPVRVSVSQSLTDARPDVDIRAQFKKQMVDKELAVTVLCRKTQKTLQQLQKVRNRLTEEQKELIAERKRVVEANYRETGVRDEKSPQYMDERVQSIDIEVASIDNSMIELEDRLKQSSGVLDTSFVGEAISNSVDLNWENALNLLKSLDRIELEATLAYFLEDVVTLRALEDDYVQELESKEQSVANLKQQLQEVQESLYLQMKKSRVVNFADSKEEKTIGETLAEAVDPKDPVDIDDLGSQAFSRQWPRLGSSQSNDAHVLTVEDSLLAPLAVRIPSPTRKNGVRPISLSPSPLVEDEPVTYRGKPVLSQKEALLSNPFLKRDRPLSPIKDLSRPSSTSAPKKEDLVKEDQQYSSNSLPSVASDDGEIRTKKRYDLLSLGGSGDVFQRLANAHTQASQAKVIHRSSIDKEAAMQQEPLPVTETKRKSLTEMEQNWHE
ncbi:Kinesin-like protein kif21b [Kappamyces sp. JEL0829]|nr:Kinesin-like protein kif21b [Kappamyces sp. JEL0829]